MQHMKHTNRGRVASRGHLKHLKTGNGPLSEKLKKRLAGVGALVVGAAFVTAAVLGFRTVASADPTTSVDPDTSNNWSSIAASSTNTQNVGRIWTDKSVFNKDYQFEGNDDLADIELGGSDFLVGLSALSSTSNLKTTTITSKPLDIVLVVDTSGSMDNSDGHDMGYSYNPTYDVRNNRDYYIQLEDGRWTEVSHNNQGWYYGSYGNRTYVNYMRWEGDTQGDRVQFYTRSNQQMSRMEALQNAANAFVDSVAAMNDDISDTAQQHRISLVKFASDENNAIGNGTNWDGYNYSQVVSDLTAYTTQTASTLKNTINSLEGEGATRADYGMHQAQRVLDGEGNLTGAREDAQKVVIFFTDGYPTTSSSWSNSVAGTAINYAYDMKQDGALVYSIGVFDEANPSDMNNNFNRYMNAVSSNYPNAECADNVNVGEWWNPQYEWQQTDDYSDLVLGNRAEGAEGEENPQYYFAASNSDELNQVFDDITTSITDNAGSGSPIEEVRQEGALNPGTLTFTDTLGSYMTVSGDTMTVVYGDQEFKSTRKTTDGNVDTYHFEGTVAGNAVYKEANLSELTVTVTRSNDLATGDVVTVQVPASLIPMRHYDVDTDAKTMTVTDAYPIRLFYGVSLKDDAEKAVEQGSGDVYDAIVQTNKADDGTVAFYSNLYNSGTGDTTATFTPSDGNKFYYYTSKTNLYVDQDCTTPATRANINDYNTLYYSEPYWQITSGNNVQEVTRGVAIERTGDDWDSIQYEDGWNGAAYIPAGTQRLDRPATLNSDKTENVTQTAATVLTPSWEGAQVSQHLGNNGKMTFPLPGQLEIKKNVDWGNASEETKAKQNNFEFTVNFNGDETLTGNFTYNVYEADEDPVSTGTVADGGTISLTANQRAVISGLPSGTTFTVTETDANQNGFTTTDSVTADPDNVTTDGIASGTIVGGDQQSVAFQNNYKADEPLTVDTADYLNVTKELNGRDWRASDEFTFKMQSVDMGSGVVAPEPENSSVTITEATKDQAVSFGDIVFTSTGTFRYIVTENNEDQIVGIDYSSASYRLEITIGDAGNGSLKVDSYKLERLQNDEGSMQPGQTESVQGNTVTFVNTYTPDAAPVNIDGVKNYTDNSGDNSIINNKFQFQMEALGGYVTDGGSRDQLTISADNTPKPTQNTQGNVTTIGNEGGEFHMPTISYTGDNVGNTYVYKITEVRGTEKGMIYDQTSYKVEVTVIEEAEPTGEEGKAHIEATVNKNPQDLKFTNTYNPTDVTLGADGIAPIKGTKTLSGRAMQEGEAFHFQLTALNDDARTVLPDARTVTVDDPSNMNFDFGEMTFTKVGQYTFQVNEVADDQGTETTDDDGMKFDTNIATVTVNVTLNKDEGKLEATVSYVNDNHTGVNDHAQFTNVYEANMNYGAEGAGGIAVTKKMVDRSMAAGDFDFTLTGTGPDGEITENFENTARAANSTVTMKQLQSLSFDEQDAGKTFSFTVDETEGSLPGVVYDQSQYRVDITVFDDHDGTMHTETTVTKTMNADGTEANEVVINKLNSDTAQGQVPTFGFENTYKPTEAKLEGDTALQVTKEVTGAPSPEGVEYSFTLTPQDTAEGSVANIGGLIDGKLTAHTTGVINEDAQDGTDDDTQTVPFGTLTFSKPGTYTFTVQEDAPDDLDGWTYDTNPKTITVVVTDRNEDNEYDGKLYIASVTPEDPVVVTNSYKPGEVVVGGDDAEQQITVQKTVTGADSTAEFTFEIEPVIDNDHTEKWWTDRVSVTAGFTPETTISSVTQEQAKTATFGGITFNAEGEYQFKITEQGAADFNAGDTRNGWTYDEHASYATVTVTDTDYDGHLEASVSYNNDDATTEADQAVDNAAAFTNAYTTTPAELTKGAESGIGVQKHVEGAPNSTNFAFTATFNADASAEQAADAGMAAGEAASIEGLTDGKLSVTINDDFNAGDTKAADFDTIKLTKPGVYVFDVTEDNAKSEAPNGWTYDKATHQITVTVTDNGQGELVASVENNDPMFTNSYQAGAATGVPANFSFTKQFTGHEWTDNYSFEFTLAAQNSELADGTPVAAADVPMPASATKTVSAPDQEGGDTAAFDFGSISYDKAGTYNYTVTETNAGQGGITYVAQPAQVTVTVTEGKDSTGALTGQLVATATVTNGDFVNEYHASASYNASGVGGLDITKQLNNHEMADDQFSFTIEAADEAAAQKLGIQDGLTTTVTSAAAAANTPQSVKSNPFDTIVFNEKDDGVTYTYTITENKDGVDSHYKTDDTTYTVAITPTDDGDGTMTVKTDVHGAETTNRRATVAFVNSYQADPTTVGAKGAATIEGSKTLKNDTLTNGQFTFQVKSGDVVVAKGTNDANGNITFDDITYTTENLAAAVNGGSAEVGTATAQTTDAGTVYTFTYTVSEVAPAADSGVTASTAAQNVTVTVTDDGNGTLTPVVTYGDGDPLAFENVYGGDAEFALDIAGTKKIVGAQDNLNVPQLTANAYQFTITGNPAADGTPAPMPAVTTVGNDASGNVTFEDIVYTMENTFGSAPATTEAAADAATDEGIEPYTAGRTQKFIYTISETGTVDGVTNEQGTKTVEVTVTDLGGGKIKAEVTSVKTAEGADFGFTNTYNVTPETSSLTGDGGFTITKSFSSTNTDRTLAEGEYEFQLKSGNDVVATAKNAADGTVSFGGIEFTAPGTYNYTLSEVNDGKPGVNYDQNVYNVTAKATDNGDGTLTVTWDMPQAENNGVTFTNTYTAASASIQLHAAKVLDGRDLAEGEFTFELRENGEVIDTATNAADGSVDFDAIEYAEPGEHDYEIAEVAGDAEGVTYDDTVHTVHVSVTDDAATGSLATAWSYGENGAPVFHNTYVEAAAPAEPSGPTIPQTSDSTNVVLPAVLAVGGVALVAGTIAWTRRKNR